MYGVIVGGIIFDWGHGKARKTPKNVEISTPLATPKTAKILFSMKNSPQLVQYASCADDKSMKQKPEVPVFRKILV